jgi:prolyl-tRNA synthetase
MMVHGDDKGAVVPPRVSEYQAVLMPVGLTAKTTSEAKKSHMEQTEAIGKKLKDANVRVEVDTRDHYSPGWKFSEYELNGVPLRLEFGVSAPLTGTLAELTFRSPRTLPTE